MKRLLSLLLIIAVIAGVPVTSLAKTPFFQDPEAIQLASESVLMLTCYDEDYNILGTGSGFLAFEDGVVVTNYHVIEGDVASVTASTEDGLYFDINDILCFDAVADIAILKTKARTRLDLLKLGNSDSLRKGSRVVAIGSPQGFLNTVSEGLYSGVYTLDTDDTEYILFTAAISSGSSGGALFNEDGEVVGITTAVWTEGQNLNFAVPINNVIELWENYNSGTYSVTLPEEIASGVPKMYETHLIVDGAKLFDVDELLSLNSYAQQMSEKYQCDFVMVFIDGLGNYTDIGDYTEDYYSFNEYGYNDTEDGIIFVWDTSDGNCQIYVSGAPFDKDIIAGEEKFNQIFDYVFGAPDYYYCAKAYIDICAKLYEDARLYAKVPADHYVICCPADSSYADYFNALLYKAYSSGVIKKLASKYNLEDCMIEIPRPEAGSDSMDPVQEIINSGVLRIGMDPSNYPFSNLTVNGKWEGFDIDLCQYLSEQLGVEPEFKNISKLNYIAILKGQWDILMNGASAESHSKDVDITVPFIVSSTGIDETKKVYNSASDLYEDIKSRDSITEADELINAYASDTPYYKKATDIRNSTFYSKAVSEYNKGHYENAEEIFSRLSNYKSSDDYMLLIEARNTPDYMRAFSGPSYDELLLKFNFADTKEVILESYPLEFLKGKWRTLDRQYSMELTYSESQDVYHFYTTLPYPYLSDATFTIEDGIYKLSNGKESKNGYKFTVLTKDSINVYCYEDRTTRMLFRD